MNRISNSSDYWIGNLTGSSDMWWREEETKKGRDLVALASYRSAIANYVNIVTGRTDIPVTYNSNDESYTDGKKVYLSGNMDGKNFDPNVGLALHEGSHIVHSDFDLLKDLYDIVEKRYGSEGNAHTTPKIKSLLNYVEDRRIDYQIFKSAPGYQNYYHAMYDKYFNFKVIDKALRSNEHREAIWESYEFRIINFTNKNTDLDALPGLREIYRTIDLKNISRLKSTEDALNVSFKIYDIIVKNIVTSNESEEKESESKNGSDSSDSKGSNGEGSKVDTGNKEMKADGKPAPTDEMPELTPSQQRSLRNAVEKQKKLINGETKKVKLTKAEKSTISSVEKTGAYTKEVGTGKHQKTNCVILPRLTEAMFDPNLDWETQRLYPFVDTWAIKRYDGDNPVQKAVTEGINLGRILGKKLQVRNEERTTKWTRQDSGRLDKRIIAELGFNNDRVFKTTLTERYNDAFIHISIDGSGSMDGEKFNNAIKSTAAICQAASMAGNIHVQVTYRSTIHVRNNASPLLVMLYDSKVNKMIHIKKFWGDLKTSGTTPEGLCFEAISQQIINTAAGRDAYFLNYSDGMPYFSGNKMDYSGYSALNHTRDQVTNLRKNGINILSFYIENSEWGRDRTQRDFKKMYGQDASMIDPTKVVGLAKELNKKFLQK
tara:strand:- start:3412 stop:5385 length:1974 start_codon:yes stop_codon:yes gene_type:complete